MDSAVSSTVQDEKLNLNDVFKDEGEVFSEQQALDDPLLESLVILTKMSHHPFSADALKAGLPLVNNRLTPELFARAAKRAGFNTKIVKRPLEKISNVVLPIVVMLEGNEACVLEKIDFENNKVSVVHPVGGNEVPIDVSIDDLKSRYSGYSIFVTRDFAFDSRSPELMKTHKRHWFWGTLWQSKGIYKDVLITSFFINIFVIATPLYIRNVFDRVIPNNAMETLWVLSVGVCIIFFFEFILKTLRSHFIEVAGKKADIVLSAMIFEKVMSLKMEARPESVGAFADKLKGFESVRNFMTSATITTVIDLPFFILFLLVIYLFAGSMVIIPIVAVVLIVSYSFLIRIPMKKLVEKSYRSSVQKNATLVEGLSSVETIKTMGAEGSVQRKWEEANGFMANQGIKVRVLSQSIGNFSGTIQNMSTVAVFIYGVHLVSIHELSAGALIACMMLTRRAIAPMVNVANLVSQYQQTKTTLQELNRIMEMPVERPDGKKFIHRPSLSGKIDFKDVSFLYPGQQVPALKNVNLTIEPGEKVAFIGRIGSGKTTLEKLILGLYSPTEGQVRIDNLDMSQVDPADLRRNIGYVAQDVMLFHGTVRDNIAVKAPYVDDSEILRVAEVAGVTEFTNRHPSGFDMPVQERGEGLSGGQRQSISIARALLLSPPVIVMDEPSNAMDNNTEAELKTNLRKEIGDRTLILITHRASLLSLVDRLVVLDNGGVIADGPKEQVLEALKQGRLKIKRSK